MTKDLYTVTAKSLEAAGAEYQFTMLAHHSYEAEELTRNALSKMGYSPFGWCISMHYNPS